MNKIETIITTAALACICYPAFGESESTRTDQWNLVWADEFETNGLPNSEKWTYDVGGSGWGNNELQYYTEARTENAEISDGVLSITAIKEDMEGMDYSSARLITRGKYDFGYGRLEIRAKLPSAVGTWPAIWMMPKDWTFEVGGWPLVGEIDIMEHVGWDLGVVHGSAHSEDYQWQKGTQKTGTINVPDAAEAFHTYVVERDESVIRMYVDDTLYFEYENEGLGVTKWPYNKPFYLILNVAVGGAWGSVKGVDATAFPQTMEVDYVRFYEKATCTHPEEN